MTIIVTEYISYHHNYKSRQSHDINSKQMTFHTSSRAKKKRFAKSSKPKKAYLGIGEPLEMQHKYGGQGVERVPSLGPLELLLALFAKPQIVSLHGFFREKLGEQIGHGKGSGDSGNGRGHGNQTGVGTPLEHDAVWGERYHVKTGAFSDENGKLITFCKKNNSEQLDIEFFLQSVGRLGATKASSFRCFCPPQSGFYGADAVQIWGRLILYVP
jgi:hypothetical protein